MCFEQTGMNVVLLDFSNFQKKKGKPATIPILHYGLCFIKKVFKIIFFILPQVYMCMFC